MTFEKRKKTRAARKTIWYSFSNDEMLLEGKVEEEMQTEGGGSGNCNGNRDETREAVKIIEWT